MSLQQEQSSSNRVLPSSGDSHDGVLLAVQPTMIIAASLTSAFSSARKMVVLFVVLVFASVSVLRVAVDVQTINTEQLIHTAETVIVDHNVPLTREIRYEFMLGSSAFWTSLEQDIATARQKVHLQAMTFEGDAVGWKVYDALKASNASSKILCVDSYSKIMISDSCVWSLRRVEDADYRQEIRDSKRLFADAPLHNVNVVFTNPLGFLFHRYPNRNHKKVMLVDDTVSYIGGINFAEHNFAWHDIMIRIDSPDIAAVLGSDFDNTVNENHQINLSRRTNVGDSVEIFSVDGRRSWGLYEELFDLLKSAKSSIKVISPYITWPFLDAIGERAKDGIDVRIISPEANNKPHMTYYLQYVQREYPFKIYMYEKNMSHLKAILIDDEILVMGSSNFDFVSYYMQQEFILVLRDPAVIVQFQEKIVNDALAHSHLYEEPAGWKQTAAYAAIATSIQFLRVVSKLNYLGMS